MKSKRRQSQTQIVIKFDRKAGIYGPFLVKGNYAYSLYTDFKIPLTKKKKKR